MCQNFGLKSQDQAGPVVLSNNQNLLLSAGNDALVFKMNALTPETLQLLQTVLDETWEILEARGKIPNDQSRNW